MSADERPWTEAHQREALARSLELAAEGTRRTQRPIAEQAGAAFLAGGFEDVRTEAGWRAWLDRATRRARHEEEGPQVNIDSEVQRVRDLAEGRRVRETATTWKVLDAQGRAIVPERWRLADVRREHQEVAPLPTDRLIRVRRTRIRRAP